MGNFQITLKKLLIWHKKSIYIIIMYIKKSIISTVKNASIFKNYIR